MPLDLAAAVEGASHEVALGDGRTWTLRPPTAADRLRLEVWLTQAASGGRVPEWEQVQRIVLGGPDRVAQAVRDLPVETITLLTWAGWLLWCRGEQAAQQWVTEQGKALTVTLIRSVTVPPSGTRTTPSTTSAAGTGTPAPTAGPDGGSGTTGPTSEPTTRE